MAYAMACHGGLETPGLKSGWDIHWIRFEGLALQSTIAMDGDVRSEYESAADRADLWKYIALDDPCWNETEKLCGIKLQIFRKNWLLGRAFMGYLRVDIDRWDYINADFVP